MVHQAVARRFCVAAWVYEDEEHRSRADDRASHRGRLGAGEAANAAAEATQRAPETRPPHFVLSEMLWVLSTDSSWRDERRDLAHRRQAERKEAAGLRRGIRGAGWHPALAGF